MGVSASTRTTTLVLAWLACLGAWFAAPALAVSLPNAADWTNTNLVKQIELAGTTSHAITTLSVRPGASRSGGELLDYYFVLAAHEAEHLAWSRLTVKPALDSAFAARDAAHGGMRPVVPLQQLGPLDADADSVVYKAEIPAELVGADGVSLTLETALNHVTQPLPKQVKQTQAQLVLWTGDAAVRSPYPTKAARIKVKAASPKIIAYTPDSATKSGSIVTFGPFENVEPIQARTKIEQGSVHFQLDAPRAVIVELRRTAEVSHWGDALSVHDRLVVRNAGAQLKGHFSRIEHQMAAFYNKASASALSTIGMSLPAGARDAWFVDDIGNVSTSRFRESRPDPSLLGASSVLPTSAGVASRMSALELQPRFPLLGGWNYTFSVGFTLPLSAGGWTRKVRASNEYITAVPLFTPIKDVAVDALTTVIVLPEAASRVQLELPYDIQLEHHITNTYLDTVGRNTIVLTQRNVAPQHAALVYIKYSLPHRANMVKVAAVAALTAALLTATAIVQRVQTRII
ncbi:oligosaccharyltransferase, alpha subunit [Moesziomyces antarcticus T-34]|uniref:Dolichyl-diphosphooligosaccharide--protein glycosyltransferase subunit 1 n=1 Tax=Pseudozyma antarctica (strain T-34) TaxID=1151754 RepID=M9MIU0_PSEA3|nr:oligosaccharyltransferase, alpha subunit [Moesziomyces antarcticus T-34]